jgi:hypothetical protein
MERRDCPSCLIDNRKKNACVLKGGKAIFFTGREKEGNATKSFTDDPIEVEKLIPLKERATRLTL